VNVFRGLNGESVKNVFTRCCGYAESLAVDTTGLVQVAFFSNADPDGAFVYERRRDPAPPAQRRSPTRRTSPRSRSDATTRRPSGLAAG
jgi:hypothetical protein